jgi:drug/metabolite transporter (DMT)-like permease
MVVSTKTLHIFNKLVLGGLHYLFVKGAIDLLKHDSVTGKEAKAGLMTFGAFFSLFIVALPVYVQEIKADRAAARKENLPAVDRYTWLSHGLTIIPGLLEWIAMYLSNRGNSVLPATIMVFMKATRVLWSALLSKFALKRALYGYHWLGVVLTFVGLAPVMAVEYMVTLDSKSSANDMIIPLACVIACEFFRAIRVILEERLLKDKGFSPAFVQYVEGYIGIVVSIVALIILQFATVEGHPVEDTMNSFQTLGSNGYCLSYFLVHCCIYGSINYSSNVVTKLLSSVHNAIISEMRIMVVWGPEFIVGWAYATYKLEGVLYEAKQFKWLKLIDIPGFIIIAASAFIYSGKLKVPISWLYPTETVVEVKDVEKVASPTTNDCCSEKACTH